MQVQAIFVCGFLLVLGVALYFARKEGSKAAQLEAIKAELRKQAREQERAKEINNSVAYMDEHTVRQRLHEIANKQQH